MLKEGIARGEVDIDQAEPMSPPYHLEVHEAAIRVGLWVAGGYCFICEEISPDQDYDPSAACLLIAAPMGNSVAGQAPCGCSCIEALLDSHFSLRVGGSDFCLLEAHDLKP